MQVRARDVAGGSHAADGLAGGDLLPGGDGHRGQVGVPDLRTVVEFQHHAVAVRPRPAGRLDGAAVDGLGGRARGGREVQARVLAGGPHGAGLAVGGGQRVGGGGEREAGGQLLQALLFGLALGGLLRLARLLGGFLLRVGLLLLGLRRRLGGGGGLHARLLGGVGTGLLLLGLLEDAGAQRLAGVRGALLGVRGGEPGGGERGGGLVGGAVAVGHERPDTGKGLGVGEAVRDGVGQGYRDRRLVLRGGDASGADRGDDTDAEDGGATGESVALLGDTVLAAYGTDGLRGGIPFLPLSVHLAVGGTGTGEPASGAEVEPGRGLGDRAV